MPMAKFFENRESPAWGLIRHRLYRSALSLTRSRADADDLTQQTLTVVLARRPENIGHLGYARRTMFHVWLDEQRSMRRRLRRLAARAKSLTPWTQVDPDADEADLHGRLRRAVEALPPQQHAVVVLRLIDELDYEEIASVLACSVGTVRANLHVARKKLRRMIGEPR